MGRRGLLSRLGSSDRTQDPVASIVAHLHTLLNSRQGHSPTIPDYGIIDFNDVVHTLPDGIRALQQSIRDSILRHEPRLSHVTVRHVPGADRLVLRFEIVARLASNRRQVLRFRTQMRPGGRFSFE